MRLSCLQAQIEKMFEIREKLGLFDDFEVNREPFWPRINRLLGGSIILHIIVVACVVFIPPVRDALSIAAMFSDAGFVDRGYSKTHIANDAELLTMTTDQFRYPEGYWLIDQGIEIPPLATPTPTPAPVFQPPTIRHRGTEELASATPSPEATPSPLIAANPSPSPSVSAEDEKAKKKVEEQLDRVAAENGVRRPKEINTRPFKDLLADAKKKKDRGELNLSGQIELTIEADRDNEGKLQNAKVNDARGDKMLEGVALDFVSALSDSGVLDFLEGTRHLRLTAKVDDKTVEINVATEVESADRARQMEKGYSLLIVGGRIARRGKDEEVYYNHIEVTSQEKEVRLKFSMPRSEVSQMLSKYTAEK